MDLGKTVQTIQDLLGKSKHVVVIQADNPDADSLASALALEQLLGNAGKDVTLFCGVDMPSYLSYFPGHDRVVNKLPNTFDLSILVDCSTITLLEKLEQTKRIGTLKNHPSIVVDHHSSEADLPFEHILVSQPQAVSTGEILFQLAKDLKWPVDKTTAELLAGSILADSLGLTTENVTANSVRVLAELVEAGANLAELDSRRRAGMSKPLSIIAYKARLLDRIEYYCNNQLAVVCIPWKEIEQYSALYNPGVLALEELRFAEGVKITVALKSYPDGKITGKLRSNYGSKVAGDLAAHFGGGGHVSAAGFKTFGWKLDELKTELIKQTQTLLDQEKTS